MVRMISPGMMIRGCAGPAEGRFGQSTAPNHPYPRPRPNPHCQPHPYPRPRVEQWPVLPDGHGPGAPWRSFHVAPGQRFHPQYQHHPMSPPDVNYRHHQAPARPPQYQRRTAPPPTWQGAPPSLVPGATARDVAHGPPGHADPRQAPAGAPLASDAGYGERGRWVDVTSTWEAAVLQSKPVPSEPSGRASQPQSHSDVRAGERTAPSRSAAPVTTPTSASATHRYAVAPAMHHTAAAPTGLVAARLARRTGFAPQGGRLDVMAGRPPTRPPRPSRKARAQAGASPTAATTAATPATPATTAATPAAAAEPLERSEPESPPATGPVNRTKQHEQAPAPDATVADAEPGPAAQAKEFNRFANDGSFMALFLAEVCNMAVPTCSLAHVQCRAASMSRHRCTPFVGRRTSRTSNADFSGVVLGYFSSGCSRG